MAAAQARGDLAQRRFGPEGAEEQRYVELAPMLATEPLTNGVQAKAAFKQTQWIGGRAAAARLALGVDAAHGTEA